MTKEQVIRYMNLFALLLRKINESTLSISMLHALTGFEAVGEVVHKELIAIFEHNPDIEIFLGELSKKCKEITAKNNQKSLLKIYHTCIWMDQMLTYDDVSESKFSIYRLIPLKSYNYVEIDSLNDNYREVGIWINPKLPIFKTTMTLDNGTEIEKPAASRTAFSDINGEFRNISFFRWNNQYIVHNIIVPYEYEERGEESRTEGTLRVGFIPISDRSDLIVPDYRNVKEKGYEFRKMYVDSPGNEDLINTRLRQGLELACTNRVDIVFAPEMLGNWQIEQYSGKYNTFIREVYWRSIADGRKPPLITVMPSLWQNRTNSAAIIYRDGRILGRQEKYVPYIDFHSCAVEGIRQKRIREVYLIHIYGVHRIAISICAEFIDHFNREFICAQLGATLIIVPSFSHGERDFVNNLGTLFPYGTSVVWGDCCGAITHTPKVIGGCSLIGSNEICKMGDNCKCDFSCGSSKGCLFIMELPLKVVYSREATATHKAVWHIVL